MMTDWRFGDWTRRRFGISLGGLAAGAGFAGIGEAVAKKRKKRRKKRKNKKRCLKVQADCTPGGKKKCCKGLACGDVFDVAGPQCCRPENADCVEPEDCCVPSSCFEGFCKPA